MQGKKRCSDILIKRKVKRKGVIREGKKRSETVKYNDLMGMFDALDWD